MKPDCECDAIGYKCTPDGQGNIKISCAFCGKPMITEEQYAIKKYHAKKLPKVRRF